MECDVENCNARFGVVEYEVSLPAKRVGYQAEIVRSTAKAKTSLCGTHAAKAIGEGYDLKVVK